MEQAPQSGQQVSLPMFDIMQQDGFYALLVGAISQQSCQVAGFTFVDNTDLCITHQSNKAYHVVEKMQDSVSHCAAGHMNSMFIVHFGLTSLS